MNFTTFPENINPFTKKGIVKLGIDPTGPELHLGHLLPMRIVKSFKDRGCDVNIILGTFTAQIGDATGRDSTRPILTEEQTTSNADNILNQVRRILGDDITIHKNTSWHNAMLLPEFMKIISEFSVQKLLRRDNFAIRMNSNIPIAMHELMGPILQGIDSFKLNADIEVGGNDQLFNFVISREIQEKLGQEPAICVLSQIINGTDGRKMSKSFNNCIFLNDTPRDVFGKVMSISDKTMFEWLPIFFGDMSLESIDESKHPMKIKKKLATLITTEIWNSELAQVEFDNFGKLFQDQILIEDIPTVSKDIIVNVVKKIMDCSGSEAKRLLASNAVKINGEKVNDEFTPNIGDVIRIGKKNFAKVI